MERIIVIAGLLFASCYLCEGADVKYLRTSIENYLSKNRHIDVNPEYKAAARKYIHDEFKRFGLKTEYQVFQNTLDGLYPEPGKNFTNVIGVLKGSRFNTTEDKIIAVGAHYDTVKTTSGVDDNGAGVAAMLEVARQVTGETGATRNNTIMFLSFDVEEQGLYGSYYFIKEWLNPWLVKNYGGFAKARSLKPYGIIILDTVMEFNTSINSQQFPAGMEQVPSFKPAFENLKNDTYQGDFLLMIYRGGTGDTDIATSFSAAWNASGRPEFELESMPIPISDVAAIRANGLGDLLRSDHRIFWEDNIPAIFVTDSADFRGDMRYCYHNPCDDLDTMLTDDNINFLAKTSDVIAKTVNNLAETTINKVTSGASMPGWTSLILLLAVSVTSLVQCV